ncbi:MAG TPA: response regulator [bacterium]|nr:response regulator [bacterium]
MEDDPGLSELIAITLRGHGWDTAEAFSGEEALAMSRERRPRLILLDYSLPDMSGADFIAAAERTNIALPPFIVATGRGDERIAVDMMKRGARDYIVKDTQFLNVLTIAVERVLEQLDVERKLEETRQLLREHDEALLASREELRALADRLLVVPEQERTRIAREIHDQVAQDLIRLKLDLVWLNGQLAKSAPPAVVLKERVAEMIALTDGAINCVQKIATELRPAVLDSLGLCAAVEWQCREFQERYGIVCRAKIPQKDPTVDRDRATALFRILQESLNNIRRHAAATLVEVCLRSDGDGLSLTVTDNGKGFSSATLKDPLSIGLIGMRERAALLGGVADIRSEKGRGTTVEVRLPQKIKAPTGEAPS